MFRQSLIHETVSDNLISDAGPQSLSDSTVIILKSYKKSEILKYVIYLY